jgi:hypothetical protein
MRSAQYLGQNNEAKGLTASLVQFTIKKNVRVFSDYN